ncbi:hypothetical protein C1O31_09200, partial [Staphylococcus schleiferi]|nr:hypothetical protein [Staphylococcus schleiferi]
VGSGMYIRDSYRLRLSPRKASLYNTKHDNKRKLEDDFDKNRLRAIYFGIYVPGSFLYVKYILYFVIIIQFVL